MALLLLFHSRLIVDIGSAWVLRDYIGDFISALDDIVASTSNAIVHVCAWFIPKELVHFMKLSVLMYVVSFS